MPASTPAPMPMAPVPPRPSEVCYSPQDLAAVPFLAALLPSLPESALASNGCVTGDYAGALLGGGTCAYDPGQPVKRGERCCYVLSSSQPGCGRPLVIGGEARVATARSMGGWAAATREPLAVGLPRETAERIGREWLGDAVLEHASIAAFAAFGLSLLAVGAPAELLAECQRAGADEVEHARSCFLLASQYLNREYGPGPLDLSGIGIVSGLEEIAARTLLDGCVEETIAALTASAQLEVATEPRVRATLERIVADETRHAELAWTFVAWALATGGSRVARSLAAASAGLGATSADGEAARDEPTASELRLLHDAGRLSPRERAAVRKSAISRVIRPALQELSLDRA